MSEKTGNKPARVLIIAGSDSGGGAGIQGDIKTVTMLGGYAATAITALTAQNTQGVFGIHDVPDDFIKQQIDLVLEDIGADAIKTGMLHRASVIELVARKAQQYPHIPMVVDPVMTAKGGAALLASDTLAPLKNLIALATIVTPNIPEAEALLGNLEAGKPGSREIKTVDDMCRAAKEIIAMGAKAVLIKGGHLPGDQVTDILMESSHSRLLDFSSSRFSTRHTHGTGCTLASAIATSLAQGMTLEKAVERARDYVQEAIRTAPGLGKGNGPLNHRVGKWKQL